MKLRTTASLGLLLAMAAGQAVAAVARPLRLEFVARAAPALDHARPAQAPRTSNFRPATTPAGARQLGALALQDLITAPEPALDAPSSDGRLQLHFQRRGNALRNVQKGYREMCDRVSTKLWDEPNGKRVRFDVAGKPGFGVEIPLGRARKR